MGDTELAGLMKMMLSNAYFSELPEWMVAPLKATEATEVYDSVYDVSKYAGGYAVRVVRGEDPFIVLIYSDETMDILRNEDGKVVCYENVVTPQL